MVTHLFVSFGQPFGPEPTPDPVLSGEESSPTHGK
jgi:hypothetical protein